MEIYQWLVLFNHVVAIGALIVLVDGLVLLSDMVVPWIHDSARTILRKILPSYLLVVVVGVLAAPLIYQYVFAFPPCLLCWYQRVFQWPSMILIAWTYFEKNVTKFSKYIIVFCMIGLVIGIYHYLSQFGVAPSINCDATGQSVSCSGIDVIVFNFATIPFMAICSAIGTASVLAWLSKNNK